MFGLLFIPFESAFGYRSAPTNDPNYFNFAYLASKTYDGSMISTHGGGVGGFDGRDFEERELVPARWKRMEPLWKKMECFGRKEGKLCYRMEKEWMKSFSKYFGKRRG